MATEIFGVLDPAGPDPDVLHGLVAGDGGPSPVISRHGPVAMGLLDSGNATEGLLETGESLLVADARVDARMTDDVWQLTEDGEDLEVLEGTLRADGAAGLARVAADFAVARFDKERESLLLSRDAFGMRSLFWAREGSRVGFASSLEVLVQLGLTSGELAREPVANYLGMRFFGGEQAPLRGVERVLGGRWVAIGADGVERRGRWFRPEDVQVQAWSMEEAAARLRPALSAAIASRARGRRIGILLSGGRDSGSVAVAAADAGVDAVCITSTFPPADPSGEEAEAKALAEAAGHPWVGVPIPERFTQRDVAEIPEASGSPLALPSFPQALSVRDAAEEAGVGIMLDGEGGDDLFAGAPAVCLDLLRAGRLRSAGRAVRSFVETGRYSYSVLLRLLLWGVLPGRRLGNIRGRWREEPPPWLQLPLAKRPPRGVLGSGQAALVRELLDWGRDPSPELWDRLFRSRGMDYSSPIFDNRVVEIGLALPPALRAPLPRPKPLLGYAFLGELEASRKKVSFRPYFERLGATLADDFPALCPGAPAVVSQGLVKPPPEFDSLFEPESRLAALRAIGLESWLRQRTPRGD